MKSVIISQLLSDYESGKITRRQLIGVLTMLTATASDMMSAPPGFQTRTLDHVSIVAKDPQRSAEFYKNVFGLAVMKPSAAAVAGGALTDGSIRLGVGKTLIVVRPGQTPGLVDHFAFGVEPFDQDALGRILNERGIKWSDKGDAGFHVTDPDGLDVQFTTSK